MTLCMHMLGLPGGTGILRGRRGISDRGECSSPSMNERAIPRRNREDGKGRDPLGRLHINAGGARSTRSHRFDRQIDSRIIVYKPPAPARIVFIMQYLILAFAIFSCVFGQFGSFRGFPSQNAYRTTPRPYRLQSQPQPQPQYTSAAKPFIGIRSQQKDTSPDGSYTFSYETENGISVSESGYPQVGPQGQTEVVQGRFSYPAPDGTPITIEYTADENGFHAQGAHIPTPPPIPEAIKRALAANPPGPDDEKYDRQPFQQRFSGPVYNANPYRRF